MTEREPIVPLISSSVMGPLGVRHLPRLWLKVLLHAAGRLPAGYRSGIGGFDEAVCEALGVEATEFVAYLRDERPSYDACEHWLRENTSGFDHERIAAFNDKVVTFELDDARAADRRAALELPPESTLRRAVALNDLDDWNAVHAALTAPVAPASLSSEASTVN